MLVVAPLVHGRAVRLTMRRLEATIPLSMAEVHVDKDLMRAEVAMSPGVNTATANPEKAKLPRSTAPTASVCGLLTSSLHQTLELIH